MIRDTKNRANERIPTKAVGSSNVQQSGISVLNKLHKSDRLLPCIGEVLETYSDRNTCDIRYVNSNSKLLDVPVLTRTGLIDDEPYGDIELPIVGNYVVIMFIDNRETLPVILGTIMAFQSSEYDTPVTNSSSKQFTTQLLEADKPKTFKKVFPSGTTVEIKEDGSLIVETPSGTYIKIDEEASEIILEDQHGNIITIDSAGLIVEDTNSNVITLDSSGTKLEDANSNVITLDSSGTKIEDANGNDITMGMTGVTINGNLEVLNT